MPHPNIELGLDQRKSHIIPPLEFFGIDFNILYCQNPMKQVGRKADYIGKEQEEVNYFHICALIFFIKLVIRVLDSVICNA